MNLVFVYNADSGVFNTLSDIAHKMFSPETYKCNLCNLTHGYFQEREEWKAFLENLDADIEFLHRDEYVLKFVTKGTEVEVDLPAIFVKDGDELKLWIDKAVINKMSSTDELMKLIREAVLRHISGTANGDGFINLPV